MKKILGIILSVLITVPLLGAPRVSGTVSCEGKGLSGVRVTDGYSVAITGKGGRYAIDLHPGADFIYISIPDGYGVESRNGAPEFYRVIDVTKPAQKVDFALKKTNLDSRRHTFYLWADVQVYERGELDFCREAAAEVRADAAARAVPAFAISCGDIAGEAVDSMSIDIHNACASCGLPFFTVMGNHDILNNVATNEESKAQYKSWFGPTYYSFDFGQVHYVVLDDVFFYHRHYIGYLEASQLEWLKADLATVPAGSPVFVFMHIPSYSAAAARGEWNKEEMNKIVTNRNALYDILEPYKAELFTAHEHYGANYEPREGLREHVHAPLSGVFWQSLLSWDGIPWGYYVYDVDGDSLTWHYKAVGIPASTQFSAYKVGQDPRWPSCVVANVWNYDPSWKVEWYENGTYKGSMTRYKGYDQNIVSDVEVRQASEFKWKYVGAGPTDHLFRCEPSSASAVVDIVVTDRFGNKYTWSTAGSYDEDAIMSAAFEELRLDTEADGTFRTGLKWPGVWTRDISYSSILSLADICPDIIRKCLMVKVDKLGRIIEDTGTGGSWPCSTDRSIWAVAAWEVYLQTGSAEWLKQFYPIVERSLAADRVVAYNPVSGLYKGESSFIDWRVQSYPAWMEPGDIAQSECLGTNAVFYRALSVMSQAASEMAALTGSSLYSAAASEYAAQASALKDAINSSFWMADKGYYGSYIYGRRQRYLQPRSETLGESLCILWGIASPSQAASIFASMPVSQYGPTIFWPQISGQGSYHNNGIWPFVTAFYGLAAASSDCHGAMEFALRSIWDSYLAAGSNMENRVASTGTFETLLNSPRQLWSIAGNIGLYYKGLLGINPALDGLHFAPVVPWRFAGTRNVTYKYRGATLNVTVSGCGSHIRHFYLDGMALADAVVSPDIVGEHEVRIELNDSYCGVQEAVQRFKSPGVTSAGDLSCYGVPVQPVTFEPADIVDPVQSFETVAEYPILLTRKVDAQGREVPAVPAELSGVCSLDITVEQSGYYYLDFEYANGNGDISTFLKCANRSLYIDGERCGVCVFPQRGDSWEDHGWCCPVLVHLAAGTHTVALKRDSENINMSIDTDQARLFKLRVTR